MTRIDVASFNHTSFTVHDLDRTIAFFVEGCGFELLSRAPRDPQLIERMTGIAGVEVEIAFVQGPAHRLEIIKYSAPQDRQVVRPRFCDIGAWHVALDVPDMQAALKTAEAYGFTIAGEVIAIDAGPNAGRSVAYVRDEDGLTVEFLELAKT
ncbi:MAG: VOC family protein [Hyphomicrobiaceae bacterium]